MKTLGCLVAACAISAATTAVAEWEVSFYTGYQTAPHSGVTGEFGNGKPIDVSAGWEGRSFEAPPYYGLRATRWSGPWGFGAEFTHTKVYADDETLQKGELERLEFTDGLNALTVNAIRRWDRGAFTPYAGGGLGVAIPHVDVQEMGSSEKTFEYQLVGPAARAFAGVSYSFATNWAVFGEYQMTYSMVDAELDGGGSLETDIITNALNIGLSYRF
ncbi:MAG: outer membrane beta-barrel protein [Pseudomonadota bacterium]